MTRTTCLAAVILAGAFLGGCMTGSIQPPEGYLRIDGGPRYDQRFLSVDGNVIAVRRVDNPKGGTLDYWAKAVKKEMTEVAGYTLKDSQEIAAGRHKGMLFEFRTAVGSVEHTYLVAVFVDAAQIALVEAGGESEKFAPDREKLIKAIQSAG